MITYILFPIFVLAILHFLFKMVDNLANNSPMFLGTKIDMIIAGIITAITVISNLIILAI